MVVSNNGLCFTYNGNDGGFTNVWETDKTYIGKKFKFKCYFPIFTGGAVLGKPRYLPRGSLKVGVPPTAFTALCGNKSFVNAHISHNIACFNFFDNSTAGNFYYKVFTFFTVTV